MGTFHRGGGPRGQRLDRNYRRGFGAREPVDKTLQRDTEMQTGPQRKDVNAEDEMLAFGMFEPGQSERLGWLVNMVPGTVPEPSRGSNESSGSTKNVQVVDCFFIGGDGNGDFRATIVAQPYMYVAPRDQNALAELDTAIRRLHTTRVHDIVHVELEDMKQPNHLAVPLEQARKTFLKVVCKNASDLGEIKKSLGPYIRASKEDAQRSSIALGETNISATQVAAPASVAGIAQAAEMREHDVAPVNRLAIDSGVRVGFWYNVSCKVALTSNTPEVPAGMSSAELVKIPNIVTRANPVVLAYDIECTKQPLKFPDANGDDQVMMISYMVDGQGYLIVNREVVAEDIVDFTYTPKPEFPGDFQVFNETNEKSTLLRFFEEVRIAQPRVIVTYNGDSFDFPFVERRAQLNGLDMGEEIGMRCDEASGECRGRSIVHMDCLYWVNRDSYLPQGSRGLKAVTRTLLGYDPLELDPEEMTPAATEKPQLLASYSVSDAVCTYYLYLKYVHPFTFSLCNIIPLNPDDILRKGSGTLCEMLLMSEARARQIVCPNKHQARAAKTFNSHLLESETYIGGHVEALQSGVFRSDIPMKFKVDKTAIQELCEDLDKTLNFAVEVEAKRDLSEATNLNEVRQEILSQLRGFTESSTRTEEPLIYHLDVAAMYPNIILTNRLQPHAVATTQDCAACDFNEVADCKKFMSWTWRGEHYPATRGEVEMIRATVLSEGTSAEERDQVMRKRLKEYSRKTYRRGLDTVVQEKTATICQRENPFYVDTVRAFRDRRYEYKGLLKTWKKKLAKAESEGDVEAIEEAKTCVVLYDSLQLAHKCILNSFYGYVMRKGARWYSMEMAGVVTHTGAAIIRGAKDFIDRIGVSLELDTDGIWCTLPKSFPETFSIEFADGKRHSMSFICSVFNRQVSQNFSNTNYNILKNRETYDYEKTNECSIFFEVDGPYKAMILPASKEEGKSIKKRYAVFNQDGSIAELKGFELKRRGELKLIKVFQQGLFHKFLDGTTLLTCYEEVAAVANQWLDVLDQQGEMLDDDELIGLLVEQNNMSRPLTDYIANKQKSAAITTAKRLSEFLGPQMVREKGLACKYVIARKPEGLQVTERAIPVQVFSAEPAVRSKFLKRWLKVSSQSEIELRDLIDWDYYFGRLGSAILKIITIPAALQLVDNPVPRVPFPDWLVKRTRELKDPRKQTSLAGFFSVMTKDDLAKESETKRSTVSKPVLDLEDIELGDAVTEKSISTKPKAEKDYKGWLKFKKTEWIARYIARKKARQANLKQRRRKFDHLDDSGGALETLDSQPVQPAARRRRGVGHGSMLDSAQELQIGTGRLAVNLENAVSWQIISISGTRKPGDFRMWVIPQSRTGQTGDMVRIPLRINRRLYLNSRIAEAGATESNKILPRNRHRLSLYKVELTEDEYLRPTRRLTSQLHSSANDGVYGGSMPLDFQAILDLGCVCAPKSRVRSHEGLLRAGVDLEQLVIRGGDDGEFGPASYLTREDAICQAYFYSCRATDGSERYSYGLICEASKRALLVFCSSRPAVTQLNGASVWRDVLALSGDERGLPEDINIRVEHVSDETEAYRLLSIEFGRLAQTAGVGKKTVILSQCHKKVDDLLELIRGLRFFPSVEISPYAPDGDFPPVSWERKSARTFFHRFIDSSSLLLEQIETARFAGVPLGNINCKNPYGQALDVLFGRELIARNHVLWASTGPRPDLGGSEQDDNCLGELADNSEAPEVTSPGLYRTFCTELGMKDLPIATILGSTSISEMEGTDLTADISAFGEGEMATNSNTGPLDDLVGVAPAFAVMKSLVSRWHLMSSRSGPAARPAERALMELHRWVQSESSLLYDGALHKLLHGLIRKAFWQLIAELKRLGATVIHATTSRIILATPRVTVPEGVQYVRFIIHTLKEKALFNPIELADFEAMYCSLCFLDSHNFAGIPVPLELELIEGTALLEDMPTHRRSFGIEGTVLPDLRASWDLAIDLPEDARTCWYELAHKFLVEPLSIRLKDVVSSPSSVLHNAIRGDNLGPETSQVVQKLQNRLFKRIEDLRERGVDEKSVLRMVVALCHIWSLDSGTSEDITALRRSVLKFLGVREFSAEANFKKHNHPVIVRGVMCDFCSNVSDMDLARSGIKDSDEWRCDICETIFDPLKLEMMLVRTLQRKLASFQLQDLVCTKCNLVKRENMAQYCSCAGGRFKLQVDPQTWREELETLCNLAEQHQLQYLGSVVAWCRQSQLDREQRVEGLY